MIGNYLCYDSLTILDYSEREREGEYNKNQPVL